MALAMAALLVLSRPQASAHNDRPLITSAVAAMSVIAHPGIDYGVEKVDDEIEQDGEDRDHDHRSHHKGVVAVEGGEHEVAPNAGNLEYCFDDDRAGDQARRGWPGVGDDR